MMLKNKVAIITGAGSGMGRATAILFAKEGAKVCIADINPEFGNKVQEEIEREGGEAIFVQVDISSVPQVKAMIERTMIEYGKINILFNHAGLPGPGKIEEVTEDSFDDIVNVNMKGSFFATQYVVEIMKKQGTKGAILFTSSTSGVVGSPHSPIYSMTKGGVILFAKSLAKDLALHQIRVNCIAPSLNNTPMANQFLNRSGKEDLEAERKMVLDRVPMKRMGNPEEVAYAALILASDKLSFTTGMVLPVDGGYLA